jgi:hypothetical protein
MCQIHGMADIPGTVVAIAVWASPDQRSYTSDEFDCLPLIIAVKYYEITS